MVIDDLFEPSHKYILRQHSKKTIPTQYKYRAIQRTIQIESKQNRTEEDEGEKEIQIESEQNRRG